MRLVLVVAVTVAIAPVALGGTLKLPPAPVERAVVPTEKAPCGIAAHAGSIWVGVYDAGTVVRLDRQGHVTRRSRVGVSACRLAGAGDAIWVTRDRTNELVRVDLSTGRTLRVAVAPEPFDVLHAAGSLWVTSHATGIVSRLDPRTGHLLDRVVVGADPAGLAYCGGRVWVGHGEAADWITSIAPRSLATHRFPVLTKAPGWPHCIRGNLWITTPDTILRVDARSGRLRTHLGIGETLADAAAGPDGLVWVTDKQHSVVYRLSPDGRFVLDRFRSGPGAFALARAGKSMWITSFAGSDVRRYVP